MKRFISVIIGLAMTIMMTVPALADREDELTAVTEKVVDALDVAEDYTDFSGSYSDGLRPHWYLYWTKDGEDLSVTCTPDGDVTELYFWRDGGSYDRFYGYDAAFPKLTETAARRQAEKWLGRLTGEKESARIDDTSATLSLNGSYTFYGRILMNGLESPVSFSVCIGDEGLESYYRSDSFKGYVGELPGSKAGVEKADAAPLLKDAVETELYYVSDGGEARLRYIPVGPYTVVDAQSGEAVDMDALYASFGGAYYGPEAPAAAEMSMDEADNGMGRALTETELSSIANYADAGSETELDSVLRSIDDLGLGDFTLKSCSYSMGTDGDITASLRYTCEMTADNLFGYSRENFLELLDWGETPTVTKYITMDAKTGELYSVSTSYPLWETDDTQPPEQAAADRFIEAVAPGMAAASALCTLRGYNEGDAGFTYARTHEGFFYPDNYLYVSINAAAGTVDEYHTVWDEDILFASPKGIISEAEAVDAYTNALTVSLGYVAWPVGIDYDDPVLSAYADWGYNYAETLILAYCYSGADKVSGVDALTGEPVRQDPGGGYLYDDLDGVPEKEAIEMLAAAGIGFSGSSFLPGKKLTMEDAARLLLSSAGCRTDDWDDETLRSEAVREGFITAEDWEPEKILSQSEFVGMILGASRYGDAARLPGVGIGLVSRALGMSDGTLSDADCTRAEAARSLYMFMTRDP